MKTLNINILMSDDGIVTAVMDQDIPVKITFCELNNRDAMEDTASCQDSEAEYTLTKVQSVEVNEKFTDWTESLVQAMPFSIDDRTVFDFDKQTITTYEKKTIKPPTGQEKEFMASMAKYVDEL